MNAIPAEDASEQSPVFLPEADKGSIQSIERASQVLALFDQDTQTLTAAVIAERLGLNRTTAHRYLLSLQSSGFLNRTNGPGPLLDQLSAVVSARRKVLTLAPPILRRLSDQTGMTAVLTTLGRSGPTVMHVEESSYGTIVLTVRVGTILELKSAQGRTLLAYQTDPATVARYHSVLSETEALQEQEELARVRRERIGWADLSHLGLAAVAAPIFGSRDVQAAMALLSTEKMLPRTDRSAGMVEMLRESADGLSKLIGA